LGITDIIVVEKRRENNLVTQDFGSTNKDRSSTEDLSSAERAVLIPNLQLLPKSERKEKVGWHFLGGLVGATEEGPPAARN
jgi:hypothetical protein